MIHNMKDLVERLKRCGCCEELTERMQLCSFDQDKTEILRILKEYQKEHQNQYEEACRHIDCIDYLIYEIEKRIK